MVFAAITLLLLMIGLLASFFGAVIYFAVFADFPRDAAALILGTLLTLKVVMAVCLVLAHQRFLQNKGLVILVILSLVLNIVIAFLHDLLPGFLTSITDAVAAIIVAIVAIIWSVLLLIGAVIAVLRVIRPPQPIGKQDEAVSPGSAPGMTPQLRMTSTGLVPATEISTHLARRCNASGSLVCVSPRIDCVTTDVDASRSWRADRSERGRSDCGSTVQHDTLA